MSLHAKPPTANGRATSFTLHDPSDKPVHGQQSRLLLRPPPLHIPRLCVPRNSSEPTSFFNSNQAFSLYKSMLLRRTECRRRCPMPLSPYACHCRLSQSPQPSSTISARLAARYRVEFRLPLPLFHNSHRVAVASNTLSRSRLLSLEKMSLSLL